MTLSKPIAASDLTPAEEPFTERNAFAELVTWAQTRPRWQQDALRRLVTGGDLTDADVEELAKLCLDPGAPFEPIGAQHIAQEAANAEPIALVRMDNPTGVNALADGQSLAFARHGLTVIYGDNGSGKSGFVRVLKHACRTRDRGREILPDVAEPNPAPQTARIVYARGASDHEFDWTPAAAAHPELPSVSIFDSRSANVHVEKTNEVAYIPQPMQVMEALAAACDRVKAKLDARVEAMAAQTPHALSHPVLSAETAAGSFVHNLGAKSNIAQLELLANLTDADRARLTSLEADLAQDPKRASARLNAQKQKLDQVKQRLSRAVTAVTDEAFARRELLRTDHDAKKEAARVASEKLFGTAPLPDIGQDAWKRLWEAARAYSDQHAYPGHAFPSATPDDTRCVLCMQPLGQEAVDRFNTFEGFVKGSTKADEEAARAALDAAFEAVAEAGVPVATLRDYVTFIGADVGDAALAEAVRRAGVTAAWRARAFRRLRAAPAAACAAPDAELDAAAAALAMRVAQLSADDASPERKALVRELQELKDREALAPLVEDIKAEVERRVEIERIAKAGRDTAKKPITTQNKEFSDKLVTNALRGRFAREVEKLRVSCMPVELRKEKDREAVSYFRVCLVETPDRPVGDIFSEGEHRCVALAAFLAELVTSKRKSGIVFDDPMSSLDHIHRRAVAARLVEEAAHRQVIIFTHDLTFLFELRRQAEGQGQHVHYQTVRRRQDRPGYVEDDLPTKAKSAVQLAGALRHVLKDAKGKFDGMKEIDRTLFCKGVIEQLREAWEQAIADVIWPVLQRFDNTIKGGTFYKLAVITDQDVETVTAARSRLSEDLHASAQTLNPADVTHATLVDEVGKLETWLADILKRQTDAKKPAAA